MCGTEACPSSCVKNRRAKRDKFDINKIKIKNILCIKGHYQEGEKATGRMEENNCKSCIWHRSSIQNIKHIQRKLQKPETRGKSAMFGALNKYWVTTIGLLWKVITTRSWEKGTAKLEMFFIVHNFEMPCTPALSLWQFQNRVVHLATMEI